jgi:ABC-type branched-subunit amino acid transport system permease subunit
MKNTFKALVFGTAFAGSFNAIAQTTFTTIIATIGGLINQIIPILIAAALAYFIYGVIKFVIAVDADAKADARKIVVGGIIGLFVIVSIWGLVGVIQSSFGVGTGSTLNANQIPGVNLN